MSLKLLSLSLWDLLDCLQKEIVQKTQYRKPHVVQQLLLQNQGVGGRTWLIPNRMLHFVDICTKAYF